MMCGKPFCCAMALGIVALVVGGCMNGGEERVEGKAAQEVDRVRTLGDESEIMAVLEGWRDAYLARDLEALMSAYSIYFVSGAGVDRDEQRARHAAMFDRGLYLPMEIEFDESTTSMRATVSPVQIIFKANSRPYTLGLRKEDGEWRIDFMKGLKKSDTFRKGFRTE